MASRLTGDLTWESPPLVFESMWLTGSVRRRVPSFCSSGADQTNVRPRDGVLPSAVGSVSISVIAAHLTGGLMVARRHLKGSRPRCIRTPFRSRAERRGDRDPAKRPQRHARRGGSEVFRTLRLVAGRHGKFVVLIRDAPLASAGSSPFELEPREVVRGLDW